MSITKLKTYDERNSSFELMRMILMFMIVVHHGIVHGLGLSGNDHISTSSLNDIFKKQFQDGCLNNYCQLQHPENHIRVHRQYH